ncbi:hypothetical protein FNF31_01926 [Cafeteria roenbergensis]|uniref:Uncharacterized protein n=1 Tax=Cafeteria roenbergensis TaxID=33653 RepID=A0A5A8DIE1_CAFRO|nr:hypothetical protein FNF31_01926 [Cafeteria roenbergensis]
MADDDAFSGSFDDYGSDFEEDQKAQRATRAAEEALRTPGALAAPTALGPSALWPAQRRGPAAPAPAAG